MATPIGTRSAKSISRSRKLKSPAAKFDMGGAYRSPAGLGPMARLLRISAALRATV
jgi:hypothetical protein